MNEFQEQFLLNVKENCPNILEYLDTESYKAEVEDEDLLNDNFIFNRVVDLLLLELKELGIHMDVGDEVYTEVDSLVSMIALRVNFAYNTLSERVGSSSDMIQQVTDLLESGEYDSELVIQEVVELFKVNFPLSEQWELLYNNNMLYHNDDTFVKLIKYTLEHVEEDDPMDDAELDNIIKYTKLVAKHTELFQERVRVVSEMLPNLNTEYLIHYAKTHNQGLVNIVGEHHAQQYLYEGHPATTEGEDIQGVVDFKRSKRYHIEYYASNHVDNEGIVHLVCDSVDLSSEYFESLFTNNPIFGFRSSLEESIAYANQVANIIRSL